MREQKKEKFLQDFSNNPKYFLIRERFKKAVLLFVVEKYKKEVGPKGLTALEREKFKANLYVYLNEQMKAMLNNVLDNERQDLNQDIWMQRDVLKDEKQARIAKGLQESALDRAKRLANEFDVVNDQENAERCLTNWFVLADNQWKLDESFPLPKHFLKWGKYLRGEYYYQRERDHSHPASSMKYVMTAVFI